MHNARPMPVPVLDVASVEPLEDHEDPVREPGFDPDAVIRYPENSHSSPRPEAATVTTGYVASPRNFKALPSPRSATAQQEASDHR